MDKALGALLLLGLGVPWYFTQHATGSLPAGCAAGLAGLAAAVGALWWLSLQRDRLRADAHRRRDLKHARAGLRAIDRMSGAEFEDFVAAQLRVAGYVVTPTAARATTGWTSSPRRTASAWRSNAKGWRRPSGWPPCNRSSPGHASTAATARWW